MAYHLGGRTCLCNLAPLCRRHHRVKQARGWTLEQVSPGVLTWSTPAGRRYTVTPTWLISQARRTGAGGGNRGDVLLIVTARKRSVHVARNGRSGPGYPQRPAALEKRRRDAASNGAAAALGTSRVAAVAYALSTAGTDHERTNT